MLPELASGGKTGRVVGVGFVSCTLGQTAALCATLLGRRPPESPMRRYDEAWWVYAEQKDVSRAGMEEAVLKVIPA